MKTVKADSTHFDEYVDARIISDASSETETRALYSDYVEWCERNNMRRWSAKALSLALAERGFERRKSSTIIWLGLKLRN